jgi:hypothetical protein
MIPILLGVLIGILSSGSGLGGGFLVVPFLLHLGKEARVAVGTSFLFVLMVAVSSLLGHWRVGNIDWKTGAFLALGGVLGAQAGPFILEHVSEQSFKRFFAVLLIGTGVWLLYQSRS